MTAVGSPRTTTGIFSSSGGEVVDGKMAGFIKGDWKADLWRAVMPVS
ncbi:hypothetical protein N185_32290 [Sinorhizobium sp. GW3]|nr:hypothetical protein N185_32290 [Sinorhizobium sp. GW3]